MGLRNSFPGPSGTATTTDARIVLGGIVEDSNGTARAGIFPSNLNSIVTARTDMNVDIAAFTGVAVQFGGPIFIGNDGTIQLPSVLVSPASGTNYYVVYVKQDESTSPGTDADNLVKVAATAPSSVSFAAARATMPTGALELATVQVPTGVSATNAGGVTITQTFLYTAAEGGVVPVRNSTELAAWTPADGSLAWQIDVGVLWIRSGGAWVVNGAAPGGRVKRANAAANFGSANAWAVLNATVNWQVDQAAGGGMAAFAGTWIAPIAGVYDVEAQIRAAAVVNGIIAIKKNSTTADLTGEVAAQAVVGNNGVTYANVRTRVRMNAGDYVALAFLNTGTSTTWDVAADSSFFGIRYVEPLR